MSAHPLDAVENAGRRASGRTNEFAVTIGFIARKAIEITPKSDKEAVTGWRIDSGVLPLEWRQVDFGAGAVRLDPGKTKNGEGRTFPMTRELRQVLEQQRAITENLQRQLKVVCPRVFHRSGRPIKSFRVAFRSACKEAGCPGPRWTAENRPFVDTAKPAIPLRAIE